MNLQTMGGLLSTLIEVYRQNLKFSITTWGQLPKAEINRTPAASAADAVEREFGIDPHQKANDRVRRAEEEAEWCNTVACAGGWYAIVGRNYLDYDPGLDIIEAHGAFTVIARSEGLGARAPGTIMDMWARHFDIPVPLVRAMFMPDNYLDGTNVKLPAVIQRVQYVLDSFAHVSNSHEADRRYAMECPPRYWHDVEHSQWARGKRHPAVAEIDQENGVESVEPDTTPAVKNNVGQPPYVDAAGLR